MRGKRWEISRASLRGWLQEIGRQVFGSLDAHALRLLWLRHLPQLPFRSPPAWPEERHKTPRTLRTVPGIWTDEEAALKAFDERPLYEFFKLHPEGATRLARYGWAWRLPTVPMRQRMLLRPQEVSAPERQPHEAPPTVDPQALTDLIRAEARRLGISKVGFAPYDPKYTFARSGSREELKTGRGTVGGIPSRYVEPSTGSVIVCLLEQDWKVTQTIPSSKAERAVMRTYQELMSRACELTEFIHGNGFHAEQHGPGGQLLSIPYAVSAGLGQLGLNGQLLTPQVGSRCRITLITTNAQLVHGQPVDYGIHAICDECQLCVRRCPSGAIPNKRLYHRGVKKAKIKPERCLPVVAQVHGCAVCMKVCPVQLYGLDAVSLHFLETGQIIGKGTDKLEGYDWLDGRHYGPGEKPRITKGFLTPDGIVIDGSRTQPPDRVTSQPAEPQDLPFA